MISRQQNGCIQVQLGGGPIAVEGNGEPALPPLAGLHAWLMVASSREALHLN